MATAAFPGLSQFIFSQEETVTASPVLTTILSPVSGRSMRFTGDPLCLWADRNDFSPKLAGKALPLADSSKILDIACFMRGSVSHQSLSTLDISSIYLSSFFSTQRARNADIKSLCATAPQSHLCQRSDKGFFLHLPHLHS